MSTPHTIALVGATGRQGGAVVDALLESGQDLALRALTRSPESDRARALAERGVELVAGDVHDPEAMSALFTGADAGFAMTTMGRGGDGTVQETRDGSAIAEAARAADLPLLVYNSVGGAERESGVPHFESKRRVEEKIEELGLPHVFVRPVFFMDNFVAWGAPVENGEVVLRQPLPADVPLQLVAVRDIGRVVAAALLGRVPAGSALEIAGDELTGPQMAEILAQASGMPARYEAQDVETLADARDFYLMYRWFAESDAFQSDIEQTRAVDPELLDFTAWVRETGWQNIVRTDGE